MDTGKMFGKERTYRFYLYFMFKIFDIQNLNTTTFTSFLNIPSNRSFDFKRSFINKTFGIMYFITTINS